MLMGNFPSEYIIGYLSEALNTQHYGKAVSLNGGIMPSKSGFSVTSGFSKLTLKASVGAYEEEKNMVQELEISLAITYSTQHIRILHDSDELENAHDYASAAALVRKYCARGHHQLLEHLGLGLLSELRLLFPQAQALEMTINKPKALPDADCSYCTLRWHS